MNLTIHSGAETNPVIDGIQFFKNHKNKLVVSCVCFNPCEKRTFFAIDLIVHKDHKEIASLIYKDIFSENLLKEKIITIIDREIITLDRKYSFDDIIIEEEKIELIKENTVGFLKYGELFNKYNIPFKRGIILEGPPGNGKTLIGKILASTELFSIIWVTPKDLAGFRGTEMVRIIYELGRKISPTIVFWEDIDLMITNREDHYDQIILGELLNCLDGLSAISGIITIATTNAPEVLDKALSHRPNRFDLRIKLDNPNHNIRIKMLSKFTEDIVMSDNINFESLSERMDGFSGACVMEMVLEAKKLAVVDGNFTDTGKIIFKKEYLEKSFEKTKKIVEVVKRIGGFH